MGGIHRRTLLKGAALGGVAAAAGGPRALAHDPPGPPGHVTSDDPGCPGASPGWEVPPSTLPRDPADCPIEHIGVLMMENRSYDTYFGWLEGGRGFRNLGLDLTYTDPADGTTASPAHWAPEYRRCGHPDPNHSWRTGREQLEHGFLVGDNDEYALAYYRAEDIPTFARLARQFTVFDRYFCSVLAGTYPNRHYLHGANGGGIKTNRFPQEEGAPLGYTWPTIWDRLDAAGLTSAYYFVDLPFIAMYGPRHLAKMRPITQFFADAAAGTLPDVYFVEPGFLGDHRTDDHPGGADINAGQAYANNIARAVTTSPQWARTAFFINYDEWGGFFDHVTPPRRPDDRADSDNLSEDWGQLGFRVPALALSPYSRKGYVHHDGPYDHTSILKFIEWRWELEPLATRDATANNIGECFDFAREPRLEIGLNQMETPSLFLSSGCDTGPPAPDDFQRLAESRYLRALGVEISQPAWPDVFGNGGAAPAAPAALDALTG